MHDPTAKMTNWAIDPVEAFTDFVSSDAFKDTAKRTRAADRLSDASVVVYKSMFARFITFLNETGQTIHAVQAPAIYAFLTQEHEGRLILGSGIQYRYVRLLERVFTFLGRVPNPMADLLFGPMAEMYKLEGRNQRTVVLSAEQIEAFKKALPVSHAKERSNQPTAAWKKQRDRALQCMILGAGLKVAEAIALHIDEIEKTTEIDGTLKVNLDKAGTQGIDAKQPTFYPHVTILQEEFVPEVLEWLAVRAKLSVSGTLLFPSHKGTMLIKSTVYDQIRKTFERADINVPRMGGRTLRNSFAVSELQGETDPDELSAKLGLFEDRSIQVYQNAVPAKSET